MLTVACVLRSGGVYDASWVSRLQAGVARHLPQPHRFICLSDIEVPCERIPLEHDWPRWWAKMELFCPGQFDGRVLVVDLDTAAVGDMTEIARAVMDYNFIMLTDFYRHAGVGSGVMAWASQDVVAPIYEAFVKSPKEHMEHYRGGGDQFFIESCVNLAVVTRWQNVVPGQILSYKVHCSDGIPGNARLICLHGKPKFADMPETDPVRLAWEHAA